MTSLGLMLLCSAAFASDAPPYAPDQAVRQMRDAAQQTIGAVNETLSVNIVKETVPAAKTGLDHLAARAKETESAAQSVQAAGQPPLGELKAILKGTGSRRALDARFQDDSDALAQARERLRADGDQKNALSARADALQDETQKARAKSALREAATSLEQTRSALSDAEAALSPLTSARDDTRSAAGHMRDTEDDLERSVDLLARRAESAQSTTADAETALDAMTDENATKARAFDKTQTAEEDGKQVFNQAMALAQRSSELSSRYNALLSAVGRFDSSEKALRQKLDGAAAPLLAAEQALAKAQEIIR